MLVIDCTRRRAESYDLSDTDLAETLGGVSLALFVLERALADGDPRPVVFAAGPFASTPVPAGNEHAVATISPVTGRPLDHLAPGHWSSLMRRCGLAAIAVTGTAESWATITIENRRVSWLDARDQLGLTGRETTKRLREWYGDRSVRVCAIGEAGERGSPFATLACDGRAGARGGLGAALGAKRVKAVALRGRGDVPIADLARAEALAADVRARVLGAPSPRAMSPASLLRERRTHGLPVRNYTEPAWPALTAFARAFESRDAYVELRAGCAPCAVQCEHMYVRKERDRRHAAAGDVEGVWALGPLCGVEDGSAVLDALVRCEAYGIDPVSAGTAIAFAMEAAERGALATDLRFGDGPGLIAAIDAVANGDGPLGILAAGFAPAVAALGPESAAYAMHVDGIACGWNDPRAAARDAIALALGRRYDRFVPETSPFAEAEARETLWETLVLCRYAAHGFAELAEVAAPLVAAVSGLSVDATALRDVAVATAARRIRLGARTADDPAVLPARFADPRPERQHAGGGAV